MRRALGLLAGMNLLYASTLLLPGNWSTVPVRNSVLFTLGAFLVFQAVLIIRYSRHHARRNTSLAIVTNVKRVHFMQALFQLSFMFYWGAYWHPVIMNLSVVAIQLGFAFLFDSALSWARREPFQLGFSKLPIVFSTNLFLWFAPQFFSLQLALIAAALAAKHLLTWTREGRRSHIFNPSALPLALAAIVVLAMSPTDITTGADLPASQELGPHVFEVLFLIGLAVNLWFPTVLITGSIFATTVALHHLTRLVFGHPAYIGPISGAVFLGATLLVTDPATTPRTKTGKLLFGIAYGVLVYSIPAVLYLFDRPFSAEKVLAVPIVNLLVPWFENTGLRLSRRIEAFLKPPLPRVIESRLFHVAVWSVFFIAVSPSLKHFTKKTLLHNPTWLALSPELARRDREVVQLCWRRRDICRPFALVPEFEYLLGQER